MGLRFSNDDNKPNTAPKKGDVSGWAGNLAKNADEALTTNNIEKLMASLPKDTANRVNQTQETLDGLVSTIKDIIIRRTKGESVGADLVSFSIQARKALGGLTQDQVISLVGAGVTAIAQLEIYFEEGDKK